MPRMVPLWVSFAAICLVLESGVEATEVTLLSRTFKRQTGPPQEQTVAFSLPVTVGQPFVLRLQNGLPHGSDRVSSARITLNGHEVVQPNDLNQNVAGLERNVEVVAGSNQFIALLAGQPGGQLAISIVGTAIGPIPEPPRNFGLMANEAGYALLRWDASPSANVAKYVIYRGPSLDELTVRGEIGASALPGGGYEFRDQGLTSNAVSFYAITAINTSGAESNQSAFDATFLQDPAASHRLSKFGENLIELFEISQLLPDGKLPTIVRNRVASASESPPYRVTVLISFDVDPVTQDHLDQIAALGARVDRRVLHKTVVAALPINRFEQVQALPFVRSVVFLQQKFPAPQVSPVENVEQKLE